MQSTLKRLTTAMAVAAMPTFAAAQELIVLD